MKLYEKMRHLPKIKSSSTDNVQWDAKYLANGNKGWKYQSFVIVDKTIFNRGTFFITLVYSETDLTFNSHFKSVPEMHTLKYCFIQHLIILRK